MSELMLWTIQAEAAWDKAQSVGALKADGRRVWREFRPAYQWMMHQMSDRLPAYDGSYPIWAWASPKPDLRRSVYLRSNEPGVRIEFTASDNDVLISDFGSWLTVINQDYLSLSAADNSDFWARYERHKGDFEYMEVLRDEVEASWDRVFDLETLREHKEWNGEVDSLQAVLGRVSLDQVIKVDYFKAR